MLLMEVLHAIDVLSPAATEQDLRVLCCLKQTIRKAESAFYEQIEGKGKPAGAQKKSRPAGRP